MTLSNKEKASISELLEIIAHDNQINKKAMNLPLYYIPKPTHTLQEILRASADILDIIDKPNNNKEGLLYSPLLSALYKTKLLIVKRQDLAHRALPGVKYITLDSKSIPQLNPSDIYFIELPKV